MVEWVSTQVVNALVPSVSPVSSDPPDPPDPPDPSLLIPFPDGITDYPDAGDEPTVEAVRHVREMLGLRGDPAYPEASFVDAPQAAAVPVPAEQGNAAVSSPQQATSKLAEEFPKGKSSFYPFQ